MCSVRNFCATNFEKIKLNFRKNVKIQNLITNIDLLEKSSIWLN